MERGVETGHGRIGAEKVADADWIVRRAVLNNSFVTALQAWLDLGEAEVIALGQEIEADLLLLDERSARNVAIRLQYPVLGTVGLLVWAKRKRIIPNLRDELSLLHERGGFHLSKSLYEYALQQVGE